MARIACITVPARGHVDPMAALARTLVARGHSVIVFHVLDAEAMIRSHGLDFEPVGTITHPRGWLASVKTNAGLASTWRGAMRLLRDAASVTEMLCRELPARLRAHDIDLILADQNEAAGGMVAYRLGLPFVTIAAALPLNWEPGIPVPFVGWQPGETRWHRYRNIASMRVARFAFKPLGDTIEAIATDWRIKPGRLPEDYMSGLAQISQLTPSLDFPRRSLIGCFHYCGPLRAPREQTGPSDKTGRQAFASLGTLQGHRFALFETIAKAARACDLDLVIAHGGLLSPHEVSRLAALAEVHDFVAQDAVLASSEIAIVHGGLNTVLDALSLGVPLVLIPLAFEQGAIAARVARAGAGVVCRRPGRPVARLADTIRDVRDAASYRIAAGIVSDDIRRSGGVERAADVIETVMTNGGPVFRDAMASRDA